VIILFLGYISLWRIKRVREHRLTGVDPEVLSRASTPVQAYFANLVRLMTATVVAIIVLHSLALDHWPLLSRFGTLESLTVDVFGGLLGLVGLGLAAVAQATMGSSWRVGIDTNTQTKLVLVGIYHWIRNPTYLGLYLVNIGLWMIWPTLFVAFYCVLFFIIMEIQVRCEEEFLTAEHGESYRTYFRQSWRYLPWLY
jgi:protein-S-isoprenylcysteine O-methyltransferase Ste14